MLRNCVVALLGLGMSYGALADNAATAKSCTREAMETLNDRGNVEVYIEYFTEKGQTDAVEEIESVSLSPEFMTKHSQELATFGDDDYKPTQTFCDDAYAEVDTAVKKVDEIAKKHGYQK